MSEANQQHAIVTVERSAHLAASLLRQYAVMCDDNKVARTSAAALVGLSPSRYSSLCKLANTPDNFPSPRAALFLSVYQGIIRLQAMVNEGVLPAASRTAGPEQDRVVADVLSRS